MSDPIKRPTIYICGPMTGYPEYNYPEFKRVEERLRDYGYEIENPVVNDTLLRDLGIGNPGWDDYMRASIAQVLKADGLCCLEGWQWSPGARLEVEIAMALKLPVRWEGQWVEIELRRAREAGEL